MPRTTPFLAVAAILLGCGGDPPEGSNAPGESGVDLRDPFVDVLETRGAPEASEDWSFVPFSDQGAWFGFALPPADRPDLRGAFTGPFLMAEGRWLSDFVAKVSLTDGATEVPLSLAGAKDFRAFALPGSLHQEATLGDLEFRLALWFHSKSTALVRVATTNNRNEISSLDIVWSGQLFEDMGRATGTSGVSVLTESGERLGITGSGASRRQLGPTHSWFSPTESHSIAPGETLTSTIAISLSHIGDRPPSQPELEAILVESESSLSANAARWNGYLESIDVDRGAAEPRQILAVKAVQTLVNNWRGPLGRLRHSGLFPSSNVWYFNGFWAWDSWKHAVGLVRFEPELAKEHVRSMFDHQNESGMIADVIYLDPSEDNWRDTKPPLAGWAIETIFEATGDLDFVAELYPKLVAYHEFWYAERDHDGDGLCEYGSTDGTLVAARWESGMDNAVRFDETKMLQNGPAAWSMNQESVDLNSYLYREKLALAALAAALERPDEAARWTSEAEDLGRAIRATMFDSETGWFYDVAIDSGAFIDVQGPEGWTPLWTGVASEAQAAAAREAMLDPAKFRTHVPFPTVAADHPEFSDGYWRGLVWLDQVYFAIEGLRRYGYHSDATELTRQLFENLEGALEPGFPLFENYHPVTGAGTNVKHFSWTAAHLLLLALEDAEPTP